MDHSSEQECTILPTRHEYPDPNFVPRFPWLGKGDAGSLAEGCEDPLPDTRSLAQDEFVQRESEERSHGAHPGQDTDDGIFDAGYEFLEESAISDEFVSEAETDTQMLDPSSLSTYSRSRGGGTARDLRKGRGGKGLQKGQRKPLEPSQEFKKLHSQATLAFIDHNYNQSEEYIQRAIVNNPEMFTAYSLLSEIHLARGDKDRALAALFHGAHTRPRDTDVWGNVAELILERAGDDRPSAIRDAIYCYNRIIGVNPSQANARYRRASLYSELGYKGKAIWEYKRLLKLLPHDPKVLRHIAETYIELGDADRAIIHYDNSIAYYKSLEPEVVTSFTWSDVNIYAELLSYSVQPMEGISKLKSLSRWTLGRGKDDFWDQYDVDDREFDKLDAPRRNEVPEFIPGKNENSTYGVGLPLELRVKLGLLRLKLQDCELEEAMRHFEWLDPEDDRIDGKLFDYFDLFRDVANALRLRNCFREAIQFYEPLKQIDHYTDSSYFSEMAFCYEALDLHNEAEDCYRTIIRNDEGNVDVLIQLVKMFKNANMPDRASPYLAEIVSMSSQESKKRRNGTSTESKSPIAVALGRTAASLGPQISPSISNLLEPLPKPKPSRKKMSNQKVQEEEAQEDFQMLFIQMKKLKHLDDDVETAKSEWMRIARELIEKVRKDKTFFSLDRHKKSSDHSKDAANVSSSSNHTQVEEEIDMAIGPAQEPLDAHEDVNPSTLNEYCGIAFADWMDIFLEYALFVALDGGSSLAYEIINLTTNAKVFRDSSDAVFRIRVCWFTCALALNDSDTLCQIARYFMKDFQFVTDSYRLFSALDRLCDGPSSFFNSSSTQKFLLRQVKAMDSCLVGDQQRKALLQEKASDTSGDENGDPIKAEEIGIGVLMLYGHVLCAGRSHSSALNYFLRARALDPTNPMINLSLGLGYLHCALKRQAENRQYQIMQGMSFLSIYYDYRLSSKIAIERQEAEFNTGRAYHMLGLTHLAIPYYERCLALDDQVKEEVTTGGLENFTREAAFALQGIWATSGNPKLAMTVTERWLVI